MRNCWRMFFVFAKINKNGNLGWETLGNALIAYKKTLSKFRSNMWGITWSIIGHMRRDGHLGSLTISRFARIYYDFDFIYFAQIDVL